MYKILFNDFDAYQIENKKIKIRNVINTKNQIENQYYLIKIRIIKVDLP